MSDIKELPQDTINHEHDFWSRMTIQQVQQILAAGGGADDKDEHGDTPLHHAAAYSGAKVIKELIKMGADVNSKNNHGKTPLHEAATYSNDVKVIKELVKAGADVNAKSNKDLTPLHLVAGFNKNFGRSIEIIKELVESGADIHAKNEFGKTPYDFLLDYNDALKYNQKARELLSSSPHMQGNEIMRKKEKLSDKWQRMVDGDWDIRWIDDGFVSAMIAHYRRRRLRV